MVVQGPLVQADLFITSNTIQSGGTLTVDPLGALLINGEGNPLLTLTSAAVGNNTSVVEAVVVGSLNGESGSLRVEGGSLSIEAGGLVSNTYGVIANSTGPSGVATVSGVGSVWENSDDLEVGDRGTCELTIEAGGLITNQRGYVARFAGSQGPVTGAGSSWTSDGNLVLGDSGVNTATTGNLDTAIGRTVNVAGTTRIHGGDNPSTIHLESGGTPNANHINFTGGTLHLTGNFTGNLDVPEFGTLMGTGTFGGLANNDLVATFGAYGLFIDYNDLDGLVSLYTQVVPAPSAMAMLIIGAGSLVLKRRRRPAD